MKETKTERGFKLLEFTDRNDQSCSIQASSTATESCVWVGVNDPNPKMLVSGVGWISYPIPEDILISTRMHLNQEQVREMLPYLQKFVETGEI